MAPLAGKPPYATDMPDSYYNQPTQQRQRQRQQPPQDPNLRSSAYDLYDSYFDPANARNSGVDAVGLGFLNGDMDDDSDDDDDHDIKKTDKHAALAAATGVLKTPSPPPQYIAAPQPGYAAPIAALNLAHPEKATGQDHRTQNQPPTYTSPSPMSMNQPHPLEPPLSPITPAFARPRPQKTDVSFALPEKPIMRGDTEETLIPRRGERGDDFWRRFSMIAKQETREGQKESAWLRKTQDGTHRLALWVWIVGIVLILAAAGGIGLGWYFSHNSPPNQQPQAFGGSANQSQGSSSSIPTVGSGGTVTVHSTLHVSPTNTVARRVYEARYTDIPMAHRRAFRH